MLLYMNCPVHILHADVVNIQVVACGHRADAVEQTLAVAGPGGGIDHHVGSGQKCANYSGSVIGHLLGFLEGHVPRHRDRDVGEILISTTPDAHTVDGKYAIETRYLADDPDANSCRRSVQQRVNSLPG